MRQIILYLSLASFLFSCQYLVTDKFPEHDKRPTVNATLVAGEPVLLNLSLSNKIDSTSIQYIDDATIELYENDVLIELLENVGDGNYASNHIVKEGNAYSTKIIVPSYDTVFASTYIPEITPITKVEIIENAGINSTGKLYSAVKITFGNNPLIDQYYQVYVKFIRDEIRHEAQFADFNDPVILNEGLPLALFSNTIISGTTYTMQLNFNPHKYMVPNKGKVWYPFVVEFQSVSYDYYQFYKSYYLYEYGRWGDGIVSPMGHTSLYSNVKNGHGVFNGFSVYTTPQIDVKEGMNHE
jgi:hypothetical protein